MEARGVLLLPLLHLEVEVPPVRLLKIAKLKPYSRKLNDSIMAFFLVLKVNKKKCSF